MNKAIVFIQISESSYDEAFLIERMSAQLRAETQVIVFSNGISSALIGSNSERVVGVLTEDQEDNLKRFQAVLEMSDVFAIVVLDLQQYFLNPMDLNFLPLWLKDLEIPLFALDYFNLLEEQEGKLGLNSKMDQHFFEAGEEPLPLDFPITLLKPTPPVLPSDFVGAQHSLAWNPIDPSLASSRPQLRKQILDSLEAPNDTKIITVAFDPLLFSQALERTLIGYYFIVVEVLIFYLRHFTGQQFQLLVVGSSAPTDDRNEIPNLNVDVHYFTHFTEDNYRAFLAASDLLIGNNNWSALLLDAMSLGTPVAVLGNSIIQDWKDESESERITVSYFQSHPALFQLSQIMMDLNRWSVSTPIFQFISYPILHTDPDFPDPGLQIQALPYILLDMFNDESTLPLLQELLFSVEKRKHYIEYCQRLLKISEKGQSFKHILEQNET